MNCPAPSLQLSATQMERFDRDGYLVVRDVFSDADLQPVIEEIEAEVDSRARKLFAEGKLSRLYDEYGFKHRLGMISRETDAVAKAIWNGSLCGPAFFHLIANPNLLDVAEQFCGPELIASSVYRLRPKLPNYAYGEVPWHQDSGYMEPFCDKATVLTVWLPLVDATEENGCMWVIKGAHKRGTVARHHGRKDKPYLIITAGDLPQGEQVCAEVPKGGVLLLHNLTPHASFENRSDHVRWSMDLRYQSAALPTNARISRLPGEIVPDEAQGIPIACYPPEADFLVRSRLRPTEVVTDPAVFHDLRAKHLGRPVTRRWSGNVTEE
ncbi:MAG: phytanoyl-CoA dioxygenase family protein [Planctomycetota bacterium]|nr:phytanoyl-CoA dioxygenase family protein [Planctomycetota bacterium]